MAHNKRKRDNLEAMDDSALFSPPRITMSVVLVELSSHIDLSALARRTLNAHYQKERFAACIIRSRKGVGLYFQSGRVVITFGHLDDRETVERMFLKKIQQIDTSISKKASRVVNTTVACQVNAKLYLNRVQKASACKRDVKFVPELFPGLAKRMPIGKNPRITCTLFCSGKYNILGCTSKEEIDEAYAASVKTLKKFINVKV